MGKWLGKNPKQAEAEVVPSSSLVEFEVEVVVGFEVEVGVEVEVEVVVKVGVEVGVEVGVKVGVILLFWVGGVGWSGWRSCR